MQGCNEVYGIRDQRPEKDRDQGSQPWDLESRAQCVGSGSAVFFMELEIKDQESDCCGFRDQNSHHFWNEGSKCWVKIWDQLRKNIPRYDPVIGLEFLDETQAKKTNG